MPQGAGIDVHTSAKERDYDARAYNNASTETSASELINALETSVNQKRNEQDSQLWVRLNANDGTVTISATSQEIRW